MSREIELYNMVHIIGSGDMYFVREQKIKSNVDIKGGLVQLVKKITKKYRNGEMAHVPYFEVEALDGTIIEVFTLDVIAEPIHESEATK